MKNSKHTFVFDENMPGVDVLFASEGTIAYRPGREISSQDVLNADALCVRSITSVDESLLQHSTLKFVGSATIGTDHIDQAALLKRNIYFANAPGCNADAVVDYVLSAIMLLAVEQNFNWREKIVGIVGVGQIGRRLAKRCRDLGLSIRLCDPPRQQQRDWEPEPFVDLQQLLEESDIVTLHTPLLEGGDHSTYHLLSRHNLPTMKANALLINASRGKVVDQNALLKIAHARPDITLVLDVWENEPDLDLALLDRVAIATPHIAGYSLEGKLRGTWMLYKAWCEFKQIKLSKTFSDVLPPSELLHLKAFQIDSPEAFLRRIYDPVRDDQALRLVMSRPETEERKKGFDQLRKSYPVRREFQSFTLEMAAVPMQWAQFFRAMGFQVVEY